MLHISPYFISSGDGILPWETMLPELIFVIAFLYNMHHLVTLKVRIPGHVCSRQKYWFSLHDLYHQVEMPWCGQFRPVANMALGGFSIRHPSTSVLLSYIFFPNNSGIEQLIAKASEIGVSFVVECEK